jgi:hypothetical protein
MKIINIIFTGVFLLISTIGCKKFVETDIETEVDLRSIGKTPAEISTVLTQAYVGLRNNNVYGTVFYQRFVNDYMVAAPGTSLAQSNIAKLSYDASDGEVLNIWQAHFDIISVTNIVIEKVTAALEDPAVKPADIAIYKRLEGEGRFLRALVYFKLVRLYRNVPIIEKFFKSLNEINEVENGATDKMREQEKAVYAFIESDLKAAALNLPVTNERGRPDRWAAKGLLGKVYVTLGSIDKFRDMSGNGSEFYTKALVELSDVIKSGQYRLKRYFPDNFIRDKQHIGDKEILFSVEYHELDKGNTTFGQGTGFIKNSASPAQFGNDNGANGSMLASDFGWSVFDVESPGDIVRRFWTFEQATFEDLNTDGVAGINNSLAVCPNSAFCEVFLISREPYPWTRPYWFETINDTRAFRFSPTGNDVATAPDGKTYFTHIWSDASNTAHPGVQFVKYRRNPVTQSTFTGANFDGDLPVFRYSEILLLYAEAANEIVGPSGVPDGGTLTATAAVNLVRDRARNFVYFNDITTSTRAVPNSPYIRTLGEIFSRQAKIGPNPATTANAADTIAKYYTQISAMKGLREVPSAPVIRNFKEFPLSAGFVPDFSSSFSPDEFRDKLLDERFRELAGEDNLRWYDLTRFGKYVERIEEYKDKINPLTNRSLASTPFGNSVLPVPNDRYEYLPIPLIEIQRNPNLKQNLGF